MTTLTRTEIRTMLEHGREDYLYKCAWCYWSSNDTAVKEDFIRRYASHCDVIAAHDSPLDPETKALVAHFLQSHAETL